METADKILLFQETFQGRSDVVARLWKSKDGRNVGYSPICSNEWKQNVCKKPCRTCPNASYVPLSAALLLDHFRGKHILGCYALLGDGTLYFIVADLDDHSGDRKPLKDLQSLDAVCNVLEIPVHALRSKSGRGYHVYIFFSSPVPAWKARAVFLALLREARVIGKQAEVSSFDKLIPDQDTLHRKKFGNLIALPFQGNAARQGHTLFLDPATGFTKPYPDQWGFLNHLTRWNEEAMDSLIADWNLTPIDPSEVRKGNRNPPGWVVEALQGVAEGARDNTGIKLAGYLADKKIPADVISTILTLWNERNQPPMEERDIQRIAHSSMRYNKQESQQDANERIGVSFVDG